MKSLYSRHLVIIESESLREAEFSLGFQWNMLLSEFSENLSVRAGVHTHRHTYPFPKLPSGQRLPWDPCCSNRKLREVSQRRTLRRETAGNKKPAETGGKSASLGLLFDSDDGGDIYSFEKLGCLRTRGRCNPALNPT
jgi:hypothetical protein